MQITIRPAKETEANQLSEIAITAKKHWGYPEAWFELWGNAFEITPDYILSNHVWVADSKSETLGFAAISVNEATAELEHMWVHPNYMRKGVGKTLMNEIILFCQHGKIEKLRIESDPNAQVFYEKMGAALIGYVESEPTPRELPVLAMKP